MRAVVCRGASLICEEIAEPAPGPGQALVKSLACGVCGSDLHAFHLWSKQDHPPTVFGHEYCAEVLESRRFKPGTRVVAMPWAKSAAGTELIGFSAIFPGGFGERMVLTEDLLLEVPNGLPTEVAALTEPMAVGAHGVACSGMDKDAVALVVGAGPVGCAVIASLKTRGFGPIVAADFSPTRRALAEKMGADVVIDPAKESPYSKWADFDVPTTIDPLEALFSAPKGKRAVIFDCVGAPGLLQAAIEGAPYGAEIMVLGVCLEPDTLVPATAVMKHMTIRTAVSYSREAFESSLRHLAEGLIDVEGFVTDRVGLSGVADAFARLSTPGDQMKILVEPQRA
jgi:2-desacetyl-2-hydroxyethyl bacteriochlorophyllide A dehydrogenase